MAGRAITMWRLCQWPLRGRTNNSVCLNLARSRCIHGRASIGRTRMQYLYKFNPKQTGPRNDRSNAYEHIHAMSISLACMERVDPASAIGLMHASESDRVRVKRLDRSRSIRLERPCTLGAGRDQTNHGACAHNRLLHVMDECSGRSPAYLYVRILQFPHASNRVLPMHACIAARVCSCMSYV